MSDLFDDRTEQQKQNDEAWFDAGANVERRLIISLLDDYRVHGTSLKSIEEVIDYIERCGHHE